MKTERLYKQDVYMKESDAIVTSVNEKDNQTLLTLNRTIFFPVGGGQSCDKGLIGGFEVTDVYEADEDIFHCVKCTGGSFAVGDKVDLKLDWGHRFDNMQRHCGEHILSGIFYREYGGVNRGFHMGEQYMTIDISLEANPEYTKIDWEMAKHAELCTNEVIWNNMPVITRHYDTRAEAENLPLRKALALDEDITIVCVGSVENPSDCVACCGTHPSTAGQVGLVKIYKVESNKGMFRIYFDAGKRAFTRYEQEFDTLMELGNKLSAGEDDITEKYMAQQEKNKEVRNRLFHLTKSVIDSEVESLRNDFSSVAQMTNQPTNPVRHYSCLAIDDLLSIGRNVSSLVPKVLFLVHDPSNTVLLISDGKIDCGKLVKENAGIYGGKGGGNKTSARAIFTKSEYIETFIDLIDKHLR